ncbi:MAG TPA: glycosyltransferase family 39 protein [Chloroflexota bacterium]|nr:glycosyltransferase family 39 protein [Chloroflexota bacterium]
MSRPLALLVTLVAFLARCWELGRQSFWWDEAYSAVVARGSLSEIVRTVAADDFHPPLHYMLLHAWRLVAGETEYALRFTSVAFGTATIALAFALGRRLFGAGGGLAAAILAAASPFLWYYATEARMFAPAAFLALLMLWLAHRRAWVGLGLCAALALYTYYYSLFVLAPVGLLALASGRRAIRGYAGALALAAGLYLPWLPVLLGRTRAWESPWTPPTSPLRVLAWTWPTLLTGIPDQAVWGLDWPRYAMLAVAGGLAAVLVLSLALRPPPDRRGGLLYAAAAGLLPLGLIALVALARPIYHPRYAAPAAPGLYLALAGAIVLPSRALRPLRLLLALALAGLFGWGLVRYADGSGLARDDYRSAVRSIEAAEQPGDAAIYNAPPGFQYYYRGAMPHRELPTGRYEPAAVVEQLDRFARGHQRLWYLTHDLRPSDPEGFLQAQLDRRAELVERRRYGQIQVALYALPAGRRFAPLPRRDVGPLLIGDALELVAVGVDDAPHPGGTALPLTLEWLVKAPVPSDLGVWVQLADEQGFRWGRGDRQPRDPNFRLTGGWLVGDRVTTGHVVPIPLGTPPGSYRLEFGLYRVEDLGGLEIRGPDGRPIGHSAGLGAARVGPTLGPAGDPGLGGATGTIDAAVELAGSGISTGQVPAGTPVETTLLWRAERPPGPRELVLRLLGPGQAVVHEQRLPTGNGRYPAERWRAGELVRDQARLIVPPTQASGAYRLWAGLAPPGGEPSGLTIGALEVRGVARLFERPPIEHRLDVAFGDGVRLAGYAVARPSPTRARLTLLWQAGGTPSRDYKVFNHVLDPAGQIVAQRDSVPADWTRPTTGWVAGEYVVDRYELELPAEARDLRLRIGLYDPATGDRLPTADGRDHLDLGALADWAG